MRRAFSRLRRHEAAAATRLAVAACIVATTAGCGGSEQERTEQVAEQIQQGAEQIQRAAEEVVENGAAGLEQVTRDLVDMARTVTAVVDHEALSNLMPEVDGWNRSGVRAEQTSVPMKVSRAEARYNRGDGTIELEIIDAALSPMLLAPMSMFLSAGFSERSGEDFRQSTRIGEHPALEEWNDRSKRGEVTVVVGNRFIVQATGHDVEELASVRGVIDAVDLARLSALK